MLRLVYPVITVVADGADQFVQGNNFAGKLQIGHKPILGSDRPRRPLRVVLVIVHKHNPIDPAGHCGIVEILIVRRHADVKLQPFSVQILGNLLQQGHVTRLRFGRNLLEVHHQAAILVGGEERVYLLPEERACVRVIQEGRDIRPVRAVRIVHHGENFHARIFRLEEGHDFIVHRVNS